MEGEEVESTMLVARGRGEVGGMVKGKEVEVTREVAGVSSRG